MNFHAIVRQWCKTYAPMLDNVSNGNRRFYLTDTTKGVVELLKDLEPKMAPCVLMESTVEGGGSFTKPIRYYPIYFFTHADTMADGDDAAAAKEEAWYHAQNFMTWLYAMRQKDFDEGRLNGDFARINFEQIMLDIQTIGPIHDGWYAVLLQIDREEPLNLCLDENLYVKEEPDVEASGTEESEGGSSDE